jgi:formate/nitrite transporter FocA (FNT family)
MTKLRLCSQFFCLMSMRAIVAYVLCVMFCRSLFVFLYFGHCVCLSFDLRILITPLVSSNSF